MRATVGSLFQAARSGGGRRGRTAAGCFLVIGMMLCAPAAWATTYAIDQDHSTVSFRIRHLFSYVRGTFNEFAGSLDYAPGHPEQWRASATIQAASIDTRVEKRDQHLRSGDFFSVEQYPTITFTSVKATNVTSAGAKLHGLLTLHGVERPVILDLTIHGEGKDQRGALRAGFTATTTINRKEFGIIWNKTLEAGQLMLGEDVEITLEIEGVAQ